MLCLIVKIYSKVCQSGFHEIQILAHGFIRRVHAKMVTELLYIILMGPQTKTENKATALRLTSFLNHTYVH